MGRVDRIAIRRPCQRDSQWRVTHHHRELAHSQRDTVATRGDGKCQHGRPVRPGWNRQVEVTALAGIQSSGKSVRFCLLAGSVNSRSHTDKPEPVRAVGDVCLGHDGNTTILFSCSHSEERMDIPEIRIHIGVAKCQRRELGGLVESANSRSKAAQFELSAGLAFAGNVESPHPLAADIQRQFHKRNRSLDCPVIFKQPGGSPKPPRVPLTGHNMTALAHFRVIDGPLRIDGKVKVGALITVGINKDFQRVVAKDLAVAFAFNGLQTRHVRLVQPDGHKQELPVVRHLEGRLYRRGLIRKIEQGETGMPCPDLPTCLIEPAIYNRRRAGTCGLNICRRPAATSPHQRHDPQYGHPSTCGCSHCHPFLNFR